MYKKMILFSELFIFWIILINKYTKKSIILGIILSFFITIIVSRSNNDNTETKTRNIFFVMIEYLFISLKEMFLSLIMYIKDIFKQEKPPFIYEIDLDIKDKFNLLLLVNLVIITPGTSVLDANLKKIVIVSSHTYSYDEVAKQILSYQKMLGEINA